MEHINQLEVLTNEEPQTRKEFVVLSGKEFKVPVLKARHLSKSLKLMTPVEEQLLAGKFEVLYQDLDILIQLVSVFYDQSIEFAEDLTTKELYEAFSEVIQTNPDFFVEVVAHLMARQ